MTDAEVSARRNIARNPSDLRGNTDFYPHCTANVETRGESCFAARNVIDGMHHSAYHGEWSFQSWGIGAREDAWCLLNFGHEVTIDQMTLTLRADFPHDAYWVNGHVVLSDGAEVAYDLEKTGNRQYIPLGTHTVRWMRLERMQKSNEPSASRLSLNGKCSGGGDGERGRTQGGAASLHPPPKGHWPLGIPFLRPLCGLKG